MCGAGGRRTPKSLSDAHAHHSCTMLLLRWILQYVIVCQRTSKNPLGVPQSALSGIEFALRVHLVCVMHSVGELQTALSCVRVCRRSVSSKVHSRMPTHTQLLHSMFAMYVSCRRSGELQNVLSHATRRIRTLCPSCVYNSYVGELQSALSRVLIT